MLNSAVVRIAGPKDEDALFDLLMDLRRDNNSFGFQVDDDRVREHIRLGTQSIGGAHGVIDAPDQFGVLAGSIGMIFDRWWFSNEWGLAQIWLFVRPEYRKGTGYADALVEWAKEIRSALARRTGHRIRLANSVISEERLEIKLRFWRRHSGQLIGGIFEIS